MIHMEPDEPSQEKRDRGNGSIFRPKYRAKNGEIRESRIFWIKYHRHGRPVRESSRSHKKCVAERLLRKRFGEIEAGLIVQPQNENRLSYEDLRASLLFDYKPNARKSLLTRKDGIDYICGLPDLDRFFANHRAVEITTPQIKDFIQQPPERGGSQRNDQQISGAITAHVQFGLRGWSPPGCSLLSDVGGAQHSQGIR